MSNPQRVIRQTFRWMYLSGIGIFCNPAPGIHILNCHRIKDNESPEQFKKVLQHLATKARLVKIEDAIELIESKQNVLEPIIAFTFDDGFMECYTHFAPILEEFGVNGLFFINPNYASGDDTYIENFDNNIVMTPGKRPMRWEQITELHKRGHVIGAHTMNHFMINSDDEEKLTYEIGKCKVVIEEKLGVPCAYFAFPYGKLSHANQKAIDIASNTYECVFSCSDYKHYFSFDGKVINRRHFEPFWPISHIDYFLSCKKKFD